jgi:hypothetical protein
MLTHFTNYPNTKGEESFTKPNVGKRGIRAVHENINSGQVKVYSRILKKES